MEVDLYALCPCGSGKKIKFCKCRDTISDLDRIARMVEGGQMVAALDRTNQVLTDHPDAAWALAIKGRLLLRLRENDKLAENAERFLRLQPSNPLALLQKAAALLGKGETAGATAAVLESMSESRESHDSLLFEISAALGMVLAEQGNLLSARAFLAMASMPDLSVAEMATSVLNEIGQNRSINLLLKYLPETLPLPAGVAWGERYEEASRLLEVNSVLLAESKLQALDRQFAGQPAILMGLLRCAIWRADQATQTKLFTRLSETSAVSEEDREYYRALSYVIEPGQPRISIPSRDLTWEINDVELALAALTADPTTIGLPPDMVREMVFGEDDVPPRAAFQLLDREFTAMDGLPAVAAAPEVLGMLLVYGRQTDRAARIIAINVLHRDEERVKRTIGAATGTGSAEPQLGEDHFAPLLNVLTSTTPAFHLRKVTAADFARWQNEYLAARLEHRFLEAPLPLFDGLTVQQASEKPEHKQKLSALVRVLEGLDQLITDVPAALESIRRKVGVAPLPSFDAPSGRALVRVPSYKLPRMTPGSAGAEDSAMVIERGRSIGCRSLVQRFAQHLLSLTLGGDLQKLKASAYLALAESAVDVQVGLRYIEQGKAWAKENNVSNATLLLSEIGFRLQAADAPGLQACIRAITSEHGSNPNVIAQLQQLLAMYGLINPDGSPRRAPGAPGPAATPAATSSGSQLWTPDAAAPAARSEGSKLWIPGMD